MMQRLTYSGAVLAALLAGGAQGATITSVFQQGVAPTTGYNMGGTFVRSDSPDANQNGYTATGGSEILVGANFAMSFRGLLEIDLSSLAGQSIQSINSVSLTMTIAQSQSPAGATASTANYNLSLCGNNTDFTETTVTWNTAASVGAMLTTATNVAPGATPGTTVIFGDSAAFEAAVLNALNGSDHTLRLVLTTAATANGQFGDFIRFASDDHTSPAYRPSLSVDYTTADVPEPAAAGLLIFGALSLLCRRRITS